MDESKRRTYSSFSGRDMSIYGMKGTLVYQLTQIQGISIRSTIHRNGQHVLGSIISLVIDSSEFRAGDELDAIIIQASNEFGGTSWCALTNVDICKHAVGISLDDIVLEDTHEFRAEGFTAWTKGRIVDSVTKNRDGRGKVIGYTLRHPIDRKAVQE